MGDGALRYDPLGRLYEVIGGSGTTRFLYDGDALVAEYDTAGERRDIYVHAGGADTPSIWFTATDLRFLHADQQGSIVAVSSSTNNAMVAVNAYDEYGIPGAGNVGRFQYTGQAWIPELGMYHYKARIYSPTLGRFLQTDPIGYDDQFNLYSYVGNDPVNASDPSGEAGCGTRLDFDSASCSGQTIVSRDLERGDLQRRGTPRPSGSAARPPRTNARMAPLGVRGQRLADPRSHLREHIGRTTRQLMGRLDRTENYSASTFRSERVMMRSLTRAVRNNQERINRWIESGDPFPLPIRDFSTTSLGTVVYRNSMAPRDAYTATFILRPIPDNVWVARQHDYYVETGFVD